MHGWVDEKLHLLRVALLCDFIHNSFNPNLFPSSGGNVMSSQISTPPTVATGNMTSSVDVTNTSSAAGATSQPAQQVSYDCNMIY